MEGSGEALYRLACKHDLEGVVAKWKRGPYLPSEDTPWIKIKNPAYTQIVGRDGLFERNSEPAMEPWRGCEEALCDSTVGDAAPI